MLKFHRNQETTNEIWKYKKMILPFIIFWVLLLIAREELGLTVILVCIAIWVIILAGFIWLKMSPYIFISLQSLFDAILVLMAFGGDIRIK